MIKLTDGKAFCTIDRVGMSVVSAFSVREERNEKDNPALAVCYYLVAGIYMLFSGAGACPYIQYRMGT